VTEPGEKNMKKRFLVICLMGMVMAGNGYSRTNAGLILSGIDTINTRNQVGFDFVTEQSCTVGIIMAPFACVNHFLFTFNANKYDLAPDAQDGPAYCITVGNVNLDSIKAAPTDSVFSSQPICAR
jgi:hypothetical protein